jgi:hypothetical protein
MLICDILPIKVFKKGSIGVNEQPVHLETKCCEYSGRGETAEVSWVSESYILGRSMSGRFVMAPIICKF